MPLGGTDLAPLVGKKILVVENSFLQSIDLAEAVAKARGEPDCASSAKAALEALEREKFDGVLLDITLGDGSSINVARRLQRDHVPFIIISGYMPEALPPELRRAPYLAKPFSQGTLIDLMACCFGRSPNAATRWRNRARTPGRYVEDTRMGFMVAPELLTQAKSKRELASLLRKTAPGLSLKIDKDTFARHAAELEREANRLEEQVRRLPK